MEEFTIKMVKIALSMFFASERKKKPRLQLLPLYNNKNANNSSSSAMMNTKEIEQEIINAQKRALIVELL